MFTGDLKLLFFVLFCFSDIFFKQHGLIGGEGDPENTKLSPVWEQTDSGKALRNFGTDMHTLERAGTVLSSSQATPKQGVFLSPNVLG